MQQPPGITLAGLRALLSAAEPLWLVYAPDEAAFAEGHIPGSLALPAPPLLAALAGQGAVVVYGEGPDATTAASIAASMEHLDVRWFRDGLAGWARAGGTVDTTPHRPITAP